MRKDDTTRSENDIAMTGSKLTQQMPTAGIEAIPLDRLLEFSQFTMNVGLFEIRDNLTKFLVQQALLETSKDRGLSLQEIANAISERYNIPDRYPELVLKQAIDSLAEEGKVIQIPSVEPPSYFINPEHKAQLKAGYASSQELHQIILNKIISEISEQYGKLYLQQEKQIQSSFYLFIGSIFSTYGYQVASLIIESSEGTVRLIELPDFQDLFSQALNTIPDSRLRSITHTVFRDFFRTPDRNGKEFILTMAQSYLVASILNLNPDLQRIRNEVLKRFLLFVDTNILIPLLTPVRKLHDANKELMSLCHYPSIGINVVISPRTKEELIDTMTATDLKMERAPRLPKSLLVKIADLPDDDFIRAYWNTLRSEPGTRWSAFISRLQHVDELLLSIHGIELNDHFDSAVRANSNLDIVTVAVMELWEEARPYRPPKHEKTAEHDAHHYLLVREFQKSEDRASRNTYFLTADRTLNNLPRRLGEEHSGPFCIYPDILVEMLFPFLTPDASREESAELLAQIFSSLYFPTKGMDWNTLIKLLRPWMAVEGLTKESIVNIMLDSYVKDTLRRHEEMEKQGLETDESEIDNALQGALEKELKRIERQRAEEAQQLRAILKAEMRKAKFRSYVIWGLIIFIAVLLATLLLYILRR